MYEYEAEVDRVIDGDTIDFMVDLGFNVHIKIRTRLLGVNTPERGHEDFALATETCKELLEACKASLPSKGKVLIKTSKTGKYGRWLVEIDGVTNILAKKWPY